MQCSFLSFHLHQLHLAMFDSICDNVLSSLPTALIVLLVSPSRAPLYPCIERYLVSFLSKLPSNSVFTFLPYSQINFHLNLLYHQHGIYIFFAPLTFTSNISQIKLIIDFSNPLPHPTYPIYLNGHTIFFPNPMTPNLGDFDDCCMSFSRVQIVSKPCSFSVKFSSLYSYCHRVGSKWLCLICSFQGSAGGHFRIDQPPASVLIPFLAAVHTYPTRK